MGIELAVVVGCVAGAAAVGAALAMLGTVVIASSWAAGLRSEAPAPAAAAAKRHDDEPTSLHPLPPPAPRPTAQPTAQPTAIAADEDVLALIDRADALDPATAPTPAFDALVDALASTRSARAVPALRRLEDRLPAHHATRRRAIWCAVRALQIGGRRVGGEVGADDRADDRMTVTDDGADDGADMAVVVD